MYSFLLILFFIVSFLFATPIQSDNSYRMRDRLKKSYLLCLKNKQEQNHPGYSCTCLFDRKNDNMISSETLVDHKDISWETSFLEEKNQLEDPENAKALRDHALDFFLQKKYDEALALAKKYYRQNPNDFRANAMLGDIYLFGKLTPAHAVFHYEKALTIIPGDKTTRMNLFRAYYMNKDYSSTIRLVDLYLKEYPRESRAWSTLGECYIEFGRLKDAQKAFAKSIEFAPDDPEKYVLLAEAYMDDKQFDASMKYLKIARKMDPTNTDTWLDIGEIYYWRGDYKTAEKLIRKAMKLEPSYFSPYNEMGNLYFLQKRYGEAEIYHKKALERFPTYHDAYRGLGRIYTETGQYGKAEAAFLKALELKPDYYGEMYVYLSEVYIKTKQYDKAESALLNGIRTDPDYPGTYASLKEFYKSRQMQDKAVQTAQLMTEHFKTHTMTKKTGQ
ncbi:MAG: tetratricopeptide repeat protein [Firmicutes bacterium]|nr:tetratricopeptide repeat protein [Bacillota bacterium]